MNAEEALERVFQNLTLWRNLPKYQLERRADIFFSLYLKEILEANLNGGDKLSEILIPEFPLKKVINQNDNGALSINIDKHHTVNVDYVMFSRNLQTIYLIEFKTDMGSHRPDQFKYLIKAKNKIQDKGLEEIVKELWSVFKATNDKQKYFHFFKHLEDLGIITLPEQIKTILYSGRKQGISEAINKYADNLLCRSTNQAIIVFIQPEPFSTMSKAELPKDTICITFSDICKVLSEIKSPFARMFARYVKAWSPKSEYDKTYLAGARPPEIIDEEIDCLKKERDDQ